MTEITEPEVPRVDEDIEDELDSLYRMTNARRKDPAADFQYERLRNHLAKYLEQNGPRFFLDSHGVKHYAYVVLPEPLVVSVAALEELVAAGEMSQEVLDEVTERKVKLESYRVACLLGKITPAQMIAVSEKRPGTAYVRISDSYPSSPSV